MNLNDLNNNNKCVIGLYYDKIKNKKKKKIIKK